MPANAITPNTSIFLSVKNNMLWKRISSVKNFGKKSKVRDEIKRSQSERLLRYREEEKEAASLSTPTGFFTIYVGDERRRFVVPMGYLSHPVFKMLLEKSSEEFGFGQKNGLVVPCSVNAFEEVVSVVESCNGKCDLSNLVEVFVEDQ